MRMDRDQGYRDRIVYSQRSRHYPICKVTLEGDDDKRRISHKLVIDSSKPHVLIHLAQSRPALYPECDIGLYD